MHFFHNNLLQLCSLVIICQKYNLTKMIISIMSVNLRINFSYRTGLRISTPSALILTHPGMIGFLGSSRIFSGLNLIEERYLLSSIPRRDRYTNAKLLIKLMSFVFTYFEAYLDCMRRKLECSLQLDLQRKPAMEIA